MSELAFGLLGSGEFEPWAAEVDRWLLDHARTGSGRVLVVPVASAPEGDDVFDGWAQRGLAHYAALGVPAEVVPIKTREDADRRAFADAIDGASVVFFPGGNPAYLAAALRETRFLEAVLEAMDRGLAYGGCSAGVACLPELAPDGAAELGPELWRPGLGIFRGAMVAPHWDALDRYVPGLRDFVLRSVPTGCRLIGLDERTAMLGDGRTWSLVGSGGVHVFLDGAWEHHAEGGIMHLPLLPSTAEVTLGAGARSTQPGGKEQHR
jgi:cyanophycinase